MSGIEFLQRGVGVYRVDGELTFYSVPGLLEKSASVFAGADAALEIDLSGVTRSDSAGIALVLEWTRMARRRGIELKFSGIPAQMHSLSQVGGVEELLAW